MTKKFWKDWQKRIGETNQVYLVTECFGKKRNSLDYSHKLLHLHYDVNGRDRIISIAFNNDTVEMVIERKTCVFDFSTRKGYHYHAENEYIILNRKDIVSVDFNKY